MSDTDQITLDANYSKQASISADDALEALKVPPHSIQGEQSVLGGLMLDDEAWDRVADKVVSTDFYRREHQLIFSAMANLAEQNQPLDVVTIAEELERRSELEEIGGMPYLGTLANETPSASNIDAYAKIVREQSVV